MPVGCAQVSHEECRPGLQPSPKPFAPRCRRRRTLLLTRVRFIVNIATFDSNLVLALAPWYDLRLLIKAMGIDLFDM